MATKAVTQAARAARAELGRKLGCVVVATDFSPGAAWALARASLLPFATGASLCLVHVREEAAPEAERDVERALERTGAMAREELAAAGARGVEVYTSAVRGKPFLEIVRRAKVEKADLIVIGRHGRRPFRDLFIGSTAERVIRKGDTAVLVVNGTPDGPYRKPIAAIDLSDLSGRALEVGLRVIAPGAASVVALHACPPLASYEVPELEASMRALDSFLVRFDGSAVRIGPVVRPGDPRGVILAQAARRRADLLVLGTHGRSGIARALIGSTAEAVLRSARCDVLVVPPARAHDFDE